MKKALVKSTGEIFDVVSEYTMMQIEINFPIDMSKELTDKLKKDFESYHVESKYKMTTGKSREDHYLLSNGETYEFDELIVGLDEIRDWKINNFKKN